MRTWDFLRLPRMGVSLKKLALAWLGMVAVYGLHLVGSYGVMWLEGMDLRTVWKLHGLLPVVRWSTLEGWPRLLAVFLVVLSLIPLYVSAVAVVRMTYRQLAGDEFYELQEALRFALRKTRTLLQALDLFALALLLVLLPLFLLGILARIPFVGPLIFVFTLPIGLFFALLLLYLAVGFLVALLTTPPAVAVARADAFDSIFEALTTLNQESGRFLLHQGLTLLSLAVGGVVFGLFLAGGWEFTVRLSAWLGGEGIHGILAAREAFLGWRVAWMGGLDTLLGFILALLQVGYFLLLPAYVWATFWSGQTLSFLLVARAKDGLDYLKMEEEEHA